MDIVPCHAIIPLHHRLSLAWTRASWVPLLYPLDHPVADRRLSSIYRFSFDNDTPQPTLQVWDTHLCIGPSNLPSTSVLVSSERTPLRVLCLYLISGPILVDVEDQGYGTPLRQYVSVYAAPLVSFDICQTHSRLVVPTPFQIKAACVDGSIEYPMYPIRSSRTSDATPDPDPLWA